MEAELTEIAGIKSVGKELKEVFSSLIKTAKPIPAIITEITGIDDEMVKDFPTASDVLPRFQKFIGDAILVAHNAEFDMGFLHHHLKKSSTQEIKNSVVCTLKLARHLLPNLSNHKLHTVGAHFKLPIENRHRAMGDVELTFQIWQNFIDMLADRGINSKHELDSILSRL